jgi:tRNA uridine 5-carboxymethylaminomethyl modification enzyme
VRPDRQTRESLLETLGIDLEKPATLFKLLQRNDLDVFRLERFAPDALAMLTREEKSILENRVKYEGYIAREEAQLARLRPLTSRSIPEAFDYASIPGLSREVVEKCLRRRPRTVGEAARIPGVTPAAVAIISAHVGRGRGLPA